MYSIEAVDRVDHEIAELIREEINRQNSHIEQIASENWVSTAVMAAMGSPLTNKYAEGYPGKRYYGGCTYVDGVETLAIERAKELLADPQINIKDVSIESGYRDANYFTRVFKRMVGKTPSEYRNGVLG